MSTVTGQASSRWRVRGQFPAENKQGRQGSDTDLDLGAGHMDLLVTFVKTHWTVHLCLVWTLSGYRSHFNEKLKDGFLILKIAYIVKGNIPKQVCFPFKQAVIKKHFKEICLKNKHDSVLTLKLKIYILIHFQPLAFSSCLTDQHNSDSTQRRGKLLEPEPSSQKRSTLCPPQEADPTTCLLLRYCLIT